MRDPGSPVRPSHPLDECEATPRRERPTWSGFDDQDTEPRLALGTHAIDEVGVTDGANGDAALDLAAIPHAVVMFDANRRIVDANPLAETLVGHTRLELVDASLDLVAAKLVGGEQAGGVHFVPASAGVRVQHRNGRAIPVEALLCRHGEQSTVAILLPVETTEAGLREDDVAQIVHDLKSPLSTIALEACLLDDKLTSGRPSDMRGALERITHNVEFLDRMVHDLLDLCSLDAGRLQLHRRPTELRTLLAQIIDRVVPTRDRARVSLRAGDPLTTSIDDLRIERVVANLLQNALKYTPKTSGVVVQLAAVNDAIRVSVDDSGPGMTPAEIGYVFDRFRRTSTAGAHEGSGLGLYVSRKIIEAHGGRIEASSVPGRGSQFFFELPAT